MKKILLFALVMMCALPVAAQDDIRRFEGEIAVGLARSTHLLDYDNQLLGWKLTTELRYNLRTLPMDFGLQISLGNYRYDDSTLHYNEIYNASYILAVADYNFRRNKNVSCFVGVGAGMSDTEFRFNETAMCVMPRVGVEFWRHLRLTASYYIADKEHSGIALTVGVVFGGGNKK